MIRPRLARPIGTLYVRRIYVGYRNSAFDTHVQQSDLHQRRRRLAAARHGRQGAQGPHRTAAGIRMKQVTAAAQPPS
jgi:hypothetical protein